MKVESYSLTQLHDLQVSFFIRRLTDENKILFNQTQYADVNHEEIFSCQLFVNGIGVLPIKRTKLKNLLLYDEQIIFNCKYRDLSYNAFVAINIWSTEKPYDENKPLGSTVVSLFCDKFKLREGKHHLMIWPDQLADCSLTSSTPGLVIDKNIDQLNFITEKVEVYEKGRETGKVLNNSEEALKLKLLYNYRLIPAAFLQIEFPSFHHPVIFQEQTYNIQSDLNSQIGGKTMYSNTSTAASEKSLKMESFDDVILFNDPDYNEKLPDPLEELFFGFIRQNPNENSKQLIPSKPEIQKMEELVKRPQRMELKPNEKLLFHKYRYYGLDKRRYLVSFLHSVQWNNQKEEVEALQLLKKWERIGEDDAFHLISNVFCANTKYNKQNAKPVQPMKAIRQYAVNILNDCSDKQLCDYMLQLVQALRYESFDESALSNMLTEKSLKNQELATLYYWYLKAQSEYIPNPKDIQAEFSHEICKMYEGRLNEFLQAVQEKDENIHEVLEEQIKFVGYLKEIAKAVKTMKTTIDKRKQELRSRITAIDWGQFKNLLLPIDTRHVLKCPIKSECSVFNSATTPLKLTFESTVNGQPSKSQFIFKVGDDLRQDQLILQMFSLMDQLLKNVNIDMKLTPYKAMACNKIEGFVEFVPRSTILQPIIKSQNKQTLKDYIEKLNNPKCPIYQQLMKKNGHTELTEALIAQYSPTVSNIIMENYCLSCAGYCAITYFFYIGDRHLQNLLITDEGKFFHIDFGFILGRDPKPYPPPIKIRKEMVEAMGGTESEVYKRFKSKCVQVYIYLRKYSKLITNLVELMIDSGIKDLNPDSLNGLYDKFGLMMKDDDAERHFLKVLDESIYTLFGALNDTIHVWGSYWR